jgi:hypothetical protein
MTITQIRAMFEVLRIPTPNVSRELKRLVTDGLVVNGTRNAGFDLTPEGRRAVSTLFAGLDADAVEAEIAEVGDAEFDHTPQPVIPPGLAPVKWAIPINSLLERYPFETNVFMMTRFPKATKEDELPDPVQRVIEKAREILGAHRLHLHLASDRQAEDELFGNIAAHMWVCKYGIGLFETRYLDEFNDNLQIEVGAMLMTGRRVAMLKDLETPDMPTDFVGQIYKPVDFEDLDAVGETLDGWVTNDLTMGH